MREIAGNILFLMEFQAYNNTVSLSITAEIGQYLSEVLVL